MGHGYKLIFYGPPPPSPPQKLFKKNKYCSYNPEMLVINYLHVSGRSQCQQPVPVQPPPPYRLARQPSYPDPPSYQHPPTIRQPGMMDQVDPREEPPGFGATLDPHLAMPPGFQAPEPGDASTIARRQAEGADPTGPMGFYLAPPAIPPPPPPPK
jgi:hypothetical protein